MASVAVRCFNFLHRNGVLHTHALCRYYDWHAIPVFRFHFVFILGFFHVNALETGVAGGDSGELVSTSSFFFLLPSLLLLCVLPVSSACHHNECPPPPSSPSPKVAEACHLGVAHPPGYPTFILLYHAAMSIGWYACPAM